MFKAGDSFIRYTNYGGIRMGVVKHVTEVLVMDLRHKVMYSMLNIVTMNGISLKLNGEDGRIYKVTRTYTEDEVTNSLEVMKKFNNLKTKPKEDV